jgi:hypothetical protein
MTRFLAIWETQGAVGWTVAPRIRTRRVACSMTAKAHRGTPLTAVVHEDHRMKLSEAHARPSDDDLTQPRSRQRLRQAGPEVTRSPLPTTRAKPTKITSSRDDEHWTSVRVSGIRQPARQPAAFGPIGPIGRSLDVTGSISSVGNQAAPSSAHRTSVDTRPGSSDMTRSSNMRSVSLSHPCPTQDVPAVALAGAHTHEGSPRRPRGDDQLVTTARLEAVSAYERAWSLPDAGKIRTELAQCWTAHSTHVTPLTDIVQGVDGLTNLILDFPVMFPGATFRITSPPDLHHDVARFAWRRQSTARIRTMGRDFGFSVEGLDYLEFDPQNRIRRVIAFFGPPTHGHPQQEEPTAQSGVTNSSWHGPPATAPPGQRPGRTFGLQPSRARVPKAPTRKVDGDGSQYAARGERLPGRPGHPPGNHRVG